MKSTLLTLFLFLIMTGSALAQLETQWIDTTTYGYHNLGYFFTNRPLKKSDEGTTIFRNRWTRRTNNMYFCMYDYEKDSIILKYQARKSSHKKVYPTEKVRDNIFYKMYYELRIRKGIKSFIFVVPGYAKTFNKQINDFMFRVDNRYSDSLRSSTAIVLFAWGDQSVSQFYHKGKRSANRAADDFSIFQHMLEEFVSDTAFFAENPDDVIYTLLCTSMGNQLFKKYLLKREKQGIDLVPVYDRIIFLGSDAGNDSFKKGKGFHNLTRMTDLVLVIVNRKDGPLVMSQYMNMKLRMGRAGPSNLQELPPSVKVWDITDMIDWEDLPAMGHDYLLRNKEIRDSLIHRDLKYQQRKFQK